MFWLFSIPRFIYFISPAAYLILNMSVYHASWIQILSFTVPYIVTLHLMMDHFYRGTRQPLFSEIYETVQSLFLIPAVIAVLLNPWNPSFSVTPKGKIIDKEYLSPVSAPFFVIIAINFVALLAAVAKWNVNPASRDVIIVTGVWCVFNIFMVILALGAFWERKQVRKFYRIGSAGSVRIHFPRMSEVLIGKVRDVSLTGIAFDVAAPFVPRDQERIVLEVMDSYGQSYRFESQIKRTLAANGRYFCGSEFMTDQVSYRDTVAYVFGDSQRWVEVWDRKSAAKGTYLMLWHFFKMGFQAVRTSTVSLLIDALRALWRLFLVLITTAIVKEKLSMLGCWLVYSFYLGLAYVLERLDQKQARKLQRSETSGQAEIYFPRTNATVFGVLNDVSLTGVGVLTELPFALDPRERVFVKSTGKDGREYRFDCMIQRAIAREGKLLCGAEFMSDIFVYPDIVKFVHGNAMQMIRSTSFIGSDLAIKGRSATFGLLRQIRNTVAPLLALLFLNPEYRAKAPKEK
jgi:hypothetical protein